MWEDIEKILLRETDILQRIEDLATQIQRDYEGKDLTLVTLLNGSVIFVAELLRRISLPVRLECLRVTSYSGTESTRSLRFYEPEMPKGKDRHFLIVDDILDTGETLHAVKERLEKDSQPLSLRTCVLLKKNVVRTRDLEADYCGFDIENEFVVGYGLDYEGYYRNLPCIATLKPEAIERRKL
ncbi:MAG: hypoxanthine phosphoribosyltransferase [Chthoniobacterales bacterium]